MPNSYSRSVNSDREAWREETPPLCMFCGIHEGVSFGPLHIHEIERKGQARDRWGVRCNYLKLCNDCHEGPFASMPHARQLAVKLIKDYQHFDLDKWLLIKHPDGKAPLRVTMLDIIDNLTVKECENE